MSDPKVTIRVGQRGAKETATQVERVAEAQRDVARESEAAAKALERQAVAASRSTTAAKAAAAATDSVAGGASSATATIGNLSESLDKGLENSVGRAFKATDRLTSIIGQATGALGLASLAVTGLTTVYTLATKALNQNTKEQEYANSIRNQATREIDAYLAAYAKMPHATAQQVAEHVKETAAVERANKNRAKAASLLQAAKDARTAALVSIKRHKEELQRGVRDYRRYMKVLHELPIAQKRLAQAQRMVTRASEDLNAAERVVDHTLERVRKRKLEAAQSSYAFRDSIVSLADSLTGGPGSLYTGLANVESIAARMWTGLQKGVEDAERKNAAAAARRAEQRKAARKAELEFQTDLQLQMMDLEHEGAKAQARGQSEGLPTPPPQPGRQMLEQEQARLDRERQLEQERRQLYAEGVAERIKASKAERDAQVKAQTAMANAVTASGQAYVSAALSAALYGGSISEAINATARAAFVEGTVGALGALAKAAVFSIINPPGVAPMLAAAKMYAAQAAVAGAIAAGTGGITGGGGGGGGAGSTAITEPTPADFGEPEQRERQDSEMFINFASGQSGRPVSRADAGAIVGALVDLARSGGYRLEARRA